ncbi:MAG TPA: hypothetical protein VFG24_02140 [Nitrosopumilaceae archaeon]|nr:hypothetical protein [Nitrosopumilaceae archaeon]
MTSCNRCGMDGLVWRFDAYDKPCLYNANTELPHDCNVTKNNSWIKNNDERDYWICFEHKKSLIISPDKWCCPVSDCTQDNFIRKSYYDKLRKTTKTVKPIQGGDSEINACRSGSEFVEPISKFVNSDISRVNQQRDDWKIIQRTMGIDEIADWELPFYDLPNYLNFPPNSLISMKYEEGITS